MEALYVCKYMDDEKSGKGFSRPSRPAAEKNTTMIGTQRQRTGVTSDHRKPQGTEKSFETCMSFH